LLRERSGANLNFINYSGTSQSLNDVIAGRIPMLVQIIPGIAGAIAAGQVKLLSITSRTRWRTFPDVPTTSEAVPGFVVGGWTVLVAPPGTPAAIVKKVNDDLRASQAQPEFKDKLAHLGAEAPPMSPRQLADFIRSEREFWRPLVRKVAANTQ
jgi:tripartite-type tricarboxylate transporter receptor subunit TctC